MDDPIIMAEGSTRYHDTVAEFEGEDYLEVQQFYRLLLAPGIGHCGSGQAPVAGIARCRGGLYPNEENQLEVLGAQERLRKALVNWVEHGRAPDRVIAAQMLYDGTKCTRSLCPYPPLAQYTGRGSTDDAKYFVCAHP